jgi:hypothetical protein
MSSLQNADWLDDVLVFLVAAGIVEPFLHRARLGSVLGFLLVGVLPVPYGLGRMQHEWPWIIWVTIEDPENVTPFADWGVIFLLFLIGLEVSVGRLWELRRYGAGALQVAVCTVVIAALLHQVGLPRTGSVILGLCLAQSSTAIVMQMLVERGRGAQRPCADGRHRADRHRRRGALDGVNATPRHAGPAGGRTAWGRRTRRAKSDRTGNSHQPRDHQRLWPGRPGGREDARERASAICGFRH